MSLCLITHQIRKWLQIMSLSNFITPKLLFNKSNCFPSSTINNLEFHFRHASLQLNWFQSSLAFRIETSHMTGFYEKHQWDEWVKTLSWRRSLSYRNQCIDLYHERANPSERVNPSTYTSTKLKSAMKCFILVLKDGNNNSI